MEIILKQDVPNLGQKDDTVTVKNGYATNYLIPQGLAILATASAKKIHAENIRQRAHKEEKFRSEATQTVNSLEVLDVIKIGAKTSSTGKIFGSVNNIQIAEALTEQGFNIDRKNISIVGEDNVKEVGIYEADIKIYKNIHAQIKFEVISE
ncbi:MAG: 50S ribosomal protein L9 [Prevotellaceae bacterium]|jgi:large subunit ribosomal protein L9|nr:50S ribosomal protein L9 [Prevotellaceae bacterium]